MPKTKGDDWRELIRRAMSGLDARIAELRAQRRRLAEFADVPAGRGAVAPAGAKRAPKKRRQVSASTRAKQKRAAEKRWAKVRAASKKKAVAPSNMAKARPPAAAKKARVPGKTGTS